MKSKLIFFSILILICINQSTLAQLNAHHSPEFDSGLDDSTSAYYSIQQLNALIAKIKAKPNQALDLFIAEINGQDSETKNNGKEVRLIYRKASNSLPISEFQIPQFSYENQFTIDFIVDERVKSNPFFLLQALVEFNLAFPIFDFTASEYFELHHKQLEKKMKENKSHQPYYISKYAEKVVSVVKSLGLKVQNGNTRPSVNSFTFFENLANANAGSVYAKKFITQFNVYNTDIFTDSMDQFFFIASASENLKKTQLSEFAKAKGLTINDQLSYESIKDQVVNLLKSKAKNENENALMIAQKQYREDFKKYKSLSEIRKQIVENQSLSELVLNNDRAQVADLLNKMLPWDLMEPTEKVFWGGFIDSIRKPDWSKSELLYRGVDNEEKMQLRVNQNHEIESAALFSKRLTAGSGSHFFKLLGLPETFEKFGVSNNDEAKKPFVEPHGVTNMMINHASVPAGSPFISLSYSPSVAYGFAMGSELKLKNKLNIEKEVKKFKSTNASGGFVAIRIDPRRLIVNSVSPFTNELEVLASLLIFPDEIVYLKKGVNFTLSILKPDVVIAQEKANNHYYSDYEYIYNNEYVTPLGQIIREVKAADQSKFPELSKANVLNTTVKETSKLDKFKKGLALIQAQYAKVSKIKYQTCFDVFK